ncbi:MAG TPA: MBL fold metallo-hydrolase [Bryobacteraceae bacterium]|nr:MBL fold metallo-hydrolase [Bryobacteraceae bacterium]
MAADSVSSIEAGDFRITLVRAGSYWWDGGALFGVVPKTLWSRHQTSDELNRIEAGFNCFVVEDGKSRILIETGGGVRHDARALERTRMLPDVSAAGSLAANGFEPESVDLVINTHLHWDHCGGNTADLPDGRVMPAFPNARYVTQRGEVEHAREQHPRDAVSYRAVNYEPLIETGRMHLLDGDQETVPGVRLQVAPGHNRDMMVVIVGGGREKWCHFADLAPYGAQITPTWVAGFDLFPVQTIETKTELFRRAAAEGWHCSFGHDPKISFARVTERDGKFALG